MLLPDGWLSKPANVQLWVGAYGGASYGYDDIRTANRFLSNGGSWDFGWFNNGEAEFIGKYISTGRDATWAHLAGVWYINGALTILDGHAQGRYNVESPSKIHIRDIFMTTAGTGTSTDYDWKSATYTMAGNPAGTIVTDYQNPITAHLHSPFVAWTQPSQNYWVVARVSDLQYAVGTRTDESTMLET